MMHKDPKGNNTGLEKSGFPFQLHQVLLVLLEEPLVLWVPVSVSRANISTWSLGPHFHEITRDSHRKINSWYGCNGLAPSGCSAGQVAECSGLREQHS